MTDLYLIDPPLEATHAPIPPNQVILGGDSAGGGLCLAMLQVCGIMYRKANGANVPLGDAGFGHSASCRCSAD